MAPTINLIDYIYQIMTLLFGKHIGEIVGIEILIRVGIERENKYQNLEHLEGLDRKKRNYENVPKWKLEVNKKEISLALKCGLRLSTLPGMEQRS